MLASSSLLKQVTEHSLSLQLRLDIRNYLVNYLANRGPELQPFVIGSLVQLLCRLTKFGWFDDDRFRDVAKESINFLNQATSDHYAIGLKILNQLVCEMNQTPSSWKPVLEDSSTLQIYFDYYALTKPPMSKEGVCGCDRFVTGSIQDVLQTIVKKDGYTGLMRGWMPRMLFHAPAAAICWSTYEAAKAFFI